MGIVRLGSRRSTDTSAPQESFETTGEERWPLKSYVAFGTFAGIDPVLATWFDARYMGWARSKIRWRRLRLSAKRQPVRIRGCRSPRRL